MAMSSYLFSFVAGRFLKLLTRKGDFPQKMLISETNSEKNQSSIPDYLLLHRKIS